MRFRNMAEEMTTKEVKLLFDIIEPYSCFLRYKRESDYIRVFYRRVNDKEDAEHRLDLLPDEVYYVSDSKESDEEPSQDVNRMYRYRQFMVAKGYSELWKDNPYIKKK